MRSLVRNLLVHSVVSALVVASAAGSAQAQVPRPGAPLSGSEVPLAEALYREGRQLMSEQHYDEACAKFAESNRLDPATGTMLNLAACFEASGKLASAWIAFGEALRASRREGRQDRVEFAELRLAAIEPRLSHLTVMVEPGSPSLVVKVDGVVIGPAAYGVAAPVDPGPHRVEAAAPGFKPWSRSITIGESTAQEKVSIPKLDPDTSVASPSFPLEREVEPVAVDSSPRHRPIPAAAYVSGGAAVLFTAGAVVSGISYLNQHRDYDSLSNDPNASYETKHDKFRSARVAGWLNAGFSAAAVVSAAITVYLYVSRPEAPATSLARRAALLKPWVSRDGAGLGLGSEF
jgi:hypothetical protein